MRKRAWKYFYVTAFIVPMVIIGYRCFQYKDENYRLGTMSHVLAQYTVPTPNADILSDDLVNAEDFIDIEGMRSENSDVVGYIRVDGTYIDYPVLRSKDQDHYLQRDFFGNQSLYGSIFLDNASYTGGSNMVLYGHNMKSGRMFGDLKHYLEPEFLDDHPHLKYIDSDTIQIYRVSAVLCASAEEDLLNKALIPYTQDEMSALAEYISLHSQEIFKLPEWGDQLLTLATCDYSNKNGRLYVIGILESKVKK